jgi:hypothetical protein
MYSMSNNPNALYDCLLPDSGMAVETINFKQNHHEAENE